MEFLRGNSYSKYPKVYSNQAKHQVKYLITQLQNNSIRQLETSIKCYRIVKAYWSITEEDILIVMRKYIIVCSGTMKVKRIQQYYDEVLVQNLSNKRFMELTQTLTWLNQAYVIQQVLLQNYNTKLISNTKPKIVKIENSRLYLFLFLFI